MCALARPLTYCERLMAFRDYFPHSKAFEQVHALISGTHAMSFYSLTLQHGVPFQPVAIRVHKDPISLIGKILNQNTHSYTKLDDLLEIGQNLVSAGLVPLAPHISLAFSGDTALEQWRYYTNRRITAMAIEAALAEDDFDTAYSYVVNRLEPPNLPQRGIPGSNEETLDIDDISWRAAYKAGCYCPVKQSGTSPLRRLEQRMELLSHVLLLAPPLALAEVLAIWRKCEEDLNALIGREAEEEDKWDDRGDGRIPGGFSADSSPMVRKARDPQRSAFSEEVPMGLLEVARGAAAALSKNAFPLRGSRSSEAPAPLREFHDRPSSGASGGGSEGSTSGGFESEGRMRKRDMVSNMVTGSLASGIGWVIGESLFRHQSFVLLFLGAPPVRQE